MNHERLAHTPDPHEAIALRAYYLWEHAGRPASESFWRQAELELMAEAKAAKPAWEKLPEPFKPLTASSNAASGEV